MTITHHSLVQSHTVPTVKSEDEGEPTVPAATYLCSLQRKLPQLRAISDRGAEYSVGATSLEDYSLKNKLWPLDKQSCHGVYENG
ncbi:hypothetical protein ACOSQ2_004277 [Xanthoceras sorbifolium]